MLRATTQAALAPKPPKVPEFARNSNYDNIPGYMKPTISATVKRTLPVRYRDAGLRKRGTRS